MTFGNITALVSVLIALGALIYTSNTKRYELTGQYRNEILKWHSCCIELLMRLRIECLDQHASKETKNELMARISAQIQIGRFYFPNIDKTDGFGQAKPVAYRGYRNLLLDFLVLSYQIFERQDACEHVKHATILQRHFTFL